MDHLSASRRLRSNTGSLPFAPHLDLISQYAAELVTARPDVIYAGGGVAIRAVQRATNSIPIVGITDDMVGEGLVESFARPNGNTTGISSPVSLTASDRTS